MLNKKQRLSTNQVAWLIKKGHRFNNESLAIKFHLNKIQENRYSVVVSKKVYPLAVDRNYLRRRLYELIRNSNFKNISTDFIIIIKDHFIQLSPIKQNQVLTEVLQNITNQQ